MKEKSNQNDESMEKISKLLESRPPQGQFREQLFWLVDVIYACKASNNRLLVEEAKLIEKALGKLGEFLKSGNQEALEDAGVRIKQFARIVKAAVTGAQLEFNIFLSYSTVDTDFFRIKEIARKLETHPDITRVYYWEKDSGQNIIEYMEDNLKRSKVFVLFCSQHSYESKSVKLERGAAIQLSQEDRIRILPVFVNPSEIPLLMKPFLGVEYNPEKFDNFILKLTEEIFRS
ncbi:MAG: toll/interleukin-1 receptor domain-containing protein [Candidatus Hermodarchaeota archaeon]